MMGAFKRGFFSIVVLGALGVMVFFSSGCQGATSQAKANQDKPAGTPVPANAAPAATAAGGAMQFSLGRVRSISFDDKQKLPDGKLAITLTKGGQNSEKLFTSGLNNVGVGTYVYLEGKTLDAGSLALKSWSWSVAGPNGARPVLENAESRTPRFMAKWTGEYTVRISATNEKGKTASSEFKVYAGRYAGVALCASCHDGSVSKDIVKLWKESGHATKVETTYERYSKESDYCVRCHTVGFDETVNDGGFDDHARVAGWDPGKDGSVLSWIKAKGMTIGDLKKDPEMGDFLGIQCENCHGPGGNGHEGIKSYRAGVCAQCHSAQPAQWQYSKHGKEADMHMAENADCVGCHTAEGFVQSKIRPRGAVFPDKATYLKPATLPAPGEMSGVTCSACHDPHAATYPFKSGEETKSLQLRYQGEVITPNGNKIQAGLSGVCVMCHANKRDVQYKTDYVAGKKTRGAHENTQSDIYYGFGAFDFGKVYDSSPHKDKVTEGCVHCHMAKNPVEDPGADGKPGTKDDLIVKSVGGHSFYVSSEWIFKDNSEKKVENVAVCQECHKEAQSVNRKAKDDYDGDGAVEGVQDEVEGLLKLVEGKLPKDDKGQVLSTTISDKNTNEMQRKALWNYAMIKADGSLGVHNYTYTVQVLQNTYKQLAGSDVTRAKIR